MSETRSWCTNELLPKIKHLSNTRRSGYFTLLSVHAIISCFKTPWVCPYQFSQDQHNLCVYLIGIPARFDFTARTCTFAKKHLIWRFYCAFYCIISMCAYDKYYQSCSKNIPLFPCVLFISRNAALASFVLKKRLVIFYILIYLFTAWTMSINQLAA